ncbi:glycosyl hydrolase family 95 catalytic domain-containing protein [Zobellia uliginosa]|uniref:glycosyl hydrolase family 95 catalytic domain-containing protein n=1 Tax=Zobellia uliginosa TaxID=143224 RepID=UPI0026E3DA51|nr:glycoside hydrolase N-terminal domain-containing protein [Zobellia uliginosa]
MKYNIVKLFIVAIIFLSCHRQDDNKKEIYSKAIYSMLPADMWQDALVSGNGAMGIMVFGQPENEQVIFNHEFLYEPIGNENVEPPNIAKYLPQTRKMLMNGDYERAINYSIDRAKDEGLPKLLWTDPYHPALVMNIQQPQINSIEDYGRSLNFETGEVVVSWKDDGQRFDRRSFVSRKDHVIVQKIGGDGAINCEISMDMQGAKPEDWATREEVPYGVSDVTRSISPDWLLFRVNYRVNKRGYDVLTKVVVNQGHTAVNDSVLSIRDAEEVLLISKIIPLEDFGKSQIEEAKEAVNEVGLDYGSLLSRHAKVHQEIFNRVDFDIYPNDSVRHATEELIAQQIENPDRISPEFLETMFYMGRYALLSSSGENPPNLMGIWNGQWRPEWSGDFTTDANVNLQISSANITDMPEAIDSYMKMLERIAPDWEINAKNIYGCRGYLSGFRTSGRRGLHTHFNASFPGQFWVSGAGWLLSPCYEYYQTTGDEKFLKERLLPMMEKTALFYEDFLTVKDSKGNFVFVPSYSPENTPSNLKVGGVINATMDIAVAKEIFTNLITVYDNLGIKSERRKQLQELRDKLPPYLINDIGGLKEWAAPNLEDNYDHRHASHFYPVWPGHEINPEETPELFDAAIIAANKRKSGNFSAHGLMHRALIGARLKQADLLYKNLSYMLSKKFIYRGMFTSHNPNLEIFNSDALCSLPTVVAEALVYSRPGFIELLPAWKEDIAVGKITNIACRTQARVKELSWDFDKGVVRCSIYSNKKQHINLLIRGYHTTWTSEDSSGKALTSKGEALEISFEEGETKTFTISLGKR